MEASLLPLVHPEATVDHLVTDKIRVGGSPEMARDSLRPPLLLSSESRVSGNTFSQSHPGQAEHCGQGEVLAPPHVDVTGFLPLSPSPLPVLLLWLWLPVHPFPTPYFCRCGSWGTPSLRLPFHTWSCLLSRCLPQEVGTWFSCPTPNPIR